MTTVSSVSIKGGIMNSLYANATSEAWATTTSNTNIINNNISSSSSSENRFLFVSISTLISSLSYAVSTSASSATSSPCTDNATLPTTTTVPFNSMGCSGSSRFLTTAASGDGSVTMVPGSGADTLQETSLEALADYRASLSVWRYCPLFLLPMGTVGNVLTLWVLTVSPLGGSGTFSVYFRALAASDLCLLYTGLLRNWISYFFAFDIRNTHSAVCRVHIWLVYVSAMTSSWFLVAMTSQRALSVVWPHRMGLMCSRRTAWLVVAAIVVFFCFLNAHNLYGYDLRFSEDYDQLYCDYLNPDYESFARAVWPWIDMAFTSLLPFALLIASNVLLMKKVASSIRIVRQLTTNGNAQDAVFKRKKISTSLNLTLIFLSSMFFLLTSPICVYLVWEYYFQHELENNSRLQAAHYLAWAVTNNLWYANSAINFYLYCLSGSKFREQVWRCLRCRGPLRQKNHSLAMRTVSKFVDAHPHKSMNFNDETTEF